MIPLWALKLGGVVVLLAGVWAHGRHVGAAAVQSRWDAQQLAERQAADTARESDRLRARAAATDYEARRAAIARRATTPSPESEYALHATICAPAGAFGRPLELGDVDLPRAVLDRLRDAGSDY